MTGVWKKLNKSTRTNFITIGVVVLIYVLCQIMVAAGIMTFLMKGLLIQFCYYAILAVSLNLTVGILGELSLGHAGFMCIGAFTSAFFSKCMVNIIENSFIRFSLAIIIGALSAALFGGVIGVVVLRVRGDYLAIVTLAFGEIIKNVINVLHIGKDSRGLHFSMEVGKLDLLEGGEAIIDGAQGIVGTPRDSNFTIGVIFLILTYIIVTNLVNSRSGRAIMAIRDNRIAAESVGIDITKYKILAFTISATLAGVAGVIYSHNITTLEAGRFGYNMSIMILVFVVLGGMGNIRGSMIAAVILTLLPEYLRFLKNYRMLIYAIVLIVMMIFNWSPACLDWRKRHSLKDYMNKLMKRFIKSKKEA